MMKMFFASLSLLLCCFLLTGAVGFDAPVMPSKDFYINDHAGVINQRERGEMLETARNIYENTGVRAVVLTVKSFDGLEPADYAGKIFDSWQLGEAHGAIGSKGILILLCTEERLIIAQTNTDVSVKDSLEKAEKLAAEGKFKDAVNGCFFDLADIIYSNGNINGGAKAVLIGSSQDTQGAAEKKERNKSNQIAITVGIAAIVMFSALSTNRKSARTSRNNMYYSGAYQRTEYQSFTERQDDDDYPAGFGGVGNRKAIYGEDVDEADEIRIIKRGNKNN